MPQVVDTYLHFQNCFDIFKPEKNFCKLKGILHQKIFYRLNLIFWIVMGCGIARFSRRGLKTTETSVIYHFALCLKVPGNQMGPRGTARNDKSLKCFISVAAPRNPMVLRLETPSCCASKPLRRPSKPHGGVPRNPR